MPSWGCIQGAFRGGKGRARTLDIVIFQIIKLPTLPEGRQRGGRVGGGGVRGVGIFIKSAIFFCIWVNNSSGFTRLNM